MVFLTIDDYKKEADHKLPRIANNYYNRAAEDERTLKRNEEAFQRFVIIPRCLRDVSSVDASSTWMGKKYQYPIAIAPTAFHKMASNEGELDTARAAAKSGSLMIASSWSTIPLEDIAREVHENNGSLWFQLYVYKDRFVTESIIKRAAACKCSAIVLTVDTPVLGRRLADLRNGFTLPKPLKLANFTSKLLDHLPEGVSGDSGLMNYVSTKIDSSLNWETVKYLKSKSPIPIIVKGIVRPDDALLAIEHGVDGIIVSNHGGRQLDSCISTIEALKPIIKVVQNKIPIFVDGGIRNGRDIFKAVAMGASAVFVGRPVIWGLAVDGENGVGNVMNILQKELTHTMQLAGCASIDDMRKTENLIVHDSQIAKL